ncbi:MAG: hypothetical protein J0L65_11125, partial [Xanthomonadales bacterium]|nr:hypothetical protein [Xanthomonadales bacterium]
MPSLLQTLQSRQWYESGSVQHLRDHFPRALGEWVRHADDAEHCRRIAAWLLGELGPAAESAAPALQRLAAAPGPDNLHSLLVLALARIEPYNPVAFSNAAALPAGTNLYGRYYAT